MQTPIDWHPDLVAVDGETTHLEAHRGGILEFAVIHLRTRAMQSWRIDPRPCEFDAASIRVNGLTPASFGVLRVRVVDFLVQFMEWIHATVPSGRALLVGRNPNFDWSFLEAAAGQLATEDRAFFLNSFHRRKLDTHGLLLGVAIARGWKLDVEKIDALYERLGLSAEAKPHTAERGVAHCVAGLDLLVREIANGGRVV